MTRNDLLLTLSEIFLSSKESGMPSASTLLATVPVRASDTPLPSTTLSDFPLEG